MKTIALLLLTFPLAMLAQTDTSARYSHPQNCCCGYHNNYTMVERNRNSPVFDFGGTLQQSGETIGTCSTTEYRRGAEKSQCIQFYLPNGVTCATATLVKRSTSVSIYTPKDGRTHTITIRSTAFPEDEIAEFLTANFYI